MQDANGVGKRALALLNASSLSELDALLAAVSQELDAGAHFFELSGFAASPTRWAVTSLPVPLMDFYHANQSHRVDPIRLRAYGSPQPFAWSALSWKQALELHNQIQGQGLQTGVACSDRGARGMLGIVAFCGLPRFLGPSAQRELLRYVTLIASAAQRACSRLIAEERRVDLISGALSFNEWRTLALIAKALTVKQASEWLGVSPRTVEYYLDQVSSKFNVKSRREAVFMALREGVPPLVFEASDLQFSTYLSQLPHSKSPADISD